MSAFVRIAFLAMLVAAAGIFNAALVDVRLEEVQYYLAKIAEDQKASQTFSIVARYELIKRRKEYGEENLQNFELEAKVAALSASKEFSELPQRTAKYYLLIPVRGILNLFRVSMGEPPINPYQENRILKALEIGYFWERNRKYNEAIAIYDDVLKHRDVATEVRAVVMAHKAFCFSMLGNYTTAKEVFENLISLYPNTQAGGLSWKLLDFIEKMQAERAAIERQQLSAFEKAKHCYLLMDYRNAIKYFSIFLSQQPLSPACMEARYYKGRSHEEMGETEEATNEYVYVIRNDQSRSWAKQANRRMVMLGEFYEQKKQMANEARRQLAAYQDEAFMHRIDQLSKLAGEGTLRKELMAGLERKSSSVASISSDDSLLALINQIGTLDLTGEHERKRKEELEKMRNELMAQGQISRAEMHEFERMQILKENPYRKPAAIRKSIADNTSQLKYLYNKKLRLGAKISGRIDIEFLIQPDGKVSNARVVRSTMNAPTFEKEITDQILTWRFPAVPESLGSMTVNYPFEFTAEE